MIRLESDANLGKVALLSQAMDADAVRCPEISVALQNHGWSMATDELLMQAAPRVDLEWIRRMAGSPMCAAKTAGASTPKLEMASRTQPMPAERAPMERAAMQDRESPVVHLEAIPQEIPACHPRRMMALPSRAGRAKAGFRAAHAESGRKAVETFRRYFRLALYLRSKASRISSIKQTAAEAGNSVTSKPFNPEKAAKVKLARAETSRTQEALPAMAPVKSQTAVVSILRAG